MEQNLKPNTSFRAGRAFLGIFLSLLVFILLIVEGYLFSLKSTILKGDSIEDILEHSGFYTSMESVLVNELLDSSETIGLSKDTLTELFPSGTLSESADVIVSSIANNEPVDLSYIKDDCVNMVETTSEKVVASVFDDFKSSSQTIDASHIANHSAIADFEKDFGIEISDTIAEEINLAFGSTTVDSSSLDIDKAKATVNDTLSHTLYPVIEQAVDQYVDLANDLISRAISQMNNDYHIDDFFKSANKGLANLHTAIIVLLVLIFLVMAIQLLLYKPYIHRAFRNISITCFLSGIIIFISSMALQFIRDIMLDELWEPTDSTSTILGDFIDTNISSLNNMFIALGVVYIVISIISMVSASILKRNSK